jgi:hypothetical protein
MGRPDGAHTHGHGGGGGLALLIVAAVVVIALGEPVAHAVAGAIQTVLIIAAVVVGAAIFGVATFLIWHLRHSIDARPAPRLYHPPAAAIPAESGPAEIHLHFHGVDPADMPAVAEAARLASLPRPPLPAVVQIDRRGGR